MGAAVSISRLDLTASELRKAASGEKNSAAARRILALALVLDGVDRKTAAETCGMDRQTLRDWVHRYNAAGLAGLRNLKSPGPGSKLTAAVQSLQRHYQSGRDHRAGADCAISSAICRPSLASTRTIPRRSCATRRTACALALHARSGVGKGALSSPGEWYGVFSHLLCT